MTHIIFWCVVLCSTLSILVVLSFQQYTFLLGLSLVMNVWSIIQSERNGFVKAKEMRRAFEPPRHFSGFQILVVVLLILVEVGIGVIVLLL
ncbi:hypothetical protein [Rhodocaloribacter sp.]